jgi:hypothetical protein
MRVKKLTPIRAIEHIHMSRSLLVSHYVCRHALQLPDLTALQRQLLTRISQLSDVNEIRLATAVYLGDHLEAYELRRWFSLNNFSAVLAQG